ncbi:amidohydrolase family protein [Methyloversatilis thermotolerans]|uniref:amidohydrolase family protein n=1 Tax=Methyloversatilis thermotolerans TaxID=1346290 RepID=UPI0003742678|nr:amidohydrolase family protein [Methyloversatilis thermotolerans]
MDARRRRLLKTGLLLGGAAASGWALSTVARSQLMNPCLAALPPELAGHELIAHTFDGLDPTLLRDVHVHLAGTGDSGRGIEMTPRMLSPLHPAEYVQRLFYLNAGCAHEDPGRVDASYVDRLHNLVEALPAGFKLMLFAFERAYDAAGRHLPEHTAFHVPDTYARDVARGNPDHFEWVCSVHPYREDAVDALETAARDGARAIKWLPPAMGIDPSSKRCDRFYAAAARLRLPLISHAGEEKAVHGAGGQALGNPLRLRRALDHGVNVIVAHCASMGRDVDLDAGRSAPLRSSFDLFARLMGERRMGRLYGDISAITLRNRDVEIIRALLRNEDWHDRLLYGSDYPLPGILPLMSPASLARAGLLDAAAAPVLEQVREHHPLLFDFMLKRLLRDGHHRFAHSVFEAAPAFPT